MKQIKKILIANRGEIAVRIIKTAKQLNIKTVAIYTDIEYDALHIQNTDEAYSLGNGELKDTYLNIDKIIQIAQRANCDAVHPGYGFLSENPLFVEACEKANIIFIGPSAKTMRLMGNKIAAREFIQNINVPTTNGITGDLNTLKIASKHIPFPLLIKAAAGGGGKGMRIVHNQAELNGALEATSREALNYFSDGTIYIEQYIENPRHIEIQILGDNQGNVVHLFERECSIQRRYQKIIEESPSPTLTDLVRQQMCETAVKIGEQIGYTSAGTIEFLVDENLNFYFLEMNTRVQVEHPITEMVTGIDIVKEQILIASSNSLSFKQHDIKQSGHALECRIYAENPSTNFLPSPGQITYYEEPNGENIRIDASIKKAMNIESNFDPMISKLIVWGENRERAINKSIVALDNYVIQGITTNISFLKGVLQNSKFKENNISTHFIDDNLVALLETTTFAKNKIPIEIPISAFLIKSLMPSQKTESIWNTIGFWRDLMQLHITMDSKEFDLSIQKNNSQHIEFKWNGNNYLIEKWQYENAKINFTLNGFPYTLYVSFEKNGIAHITYNGISFAAIRNHQLVSEDIFTGFSGKNSDDINQIFSPMPGKIIKIDIKEGDAVAKGDNLLIVEAMKMENQIIAPRNAIVGKLNVNVNDMVTSNLPLIIFQN